MRSAEKIYRKLVLVCTNAREGGANCCALRGSHEFYDQLKAEVKARFSDVRVVRTGCLGNCATGVSVVIMPDNIWLGEVTDQDIPELIEKIA